MVGSGVAGLTTAIYAARALRKPVLVQGMQTGGQLTITTDVENYPGFADVIQGPWLMDEMRGQAEHVGTEIVMDHIVSADLKTRVPIGLLAQDNRRAQQRYEADDSQGICDQEMLRLEEEGHAPGLRRSDGHQRADNQYAERPHDSKPPELPVHGDISAGRQPGLRQNNGQPTHEDNSVEMHDRGCIEA